MQSNIGRAACLSSLAHRYRGHKNARERVRARCIVWVASGPCHAQLSAHVMPNSGLRAAHVMRNNGLRTAHVMRSNGLRAAKEWPM